MGIVGLGLPLVVNMRFFFVLTLALIAACSALPIQEEQYSILDAIVDRIGNDALKDFVGKVKPVILEKVKEKFKELIKEALGIGLSGQPVPFGIFDDVIRDLVENVKGVVKGHVEEAIKGALERVKEKLAQLGYSAEYAVIDQLKNQLDSDVEQYWVKGVIKKGVDKVRDKIGKR